LLADAFRFTAQQQQQAVAMMQAGGFTPRGGVPPMLQAPPGLTPTAAAAAAAAAQFQPGSPFAQPGTPFARQPSLPPHVGGANEVAAGQEAVEVRNMLVKKKCP